VTGLAEPLEVDAAVIIGAIWEDMVDLDVCLGELAASAKTVLIVKKGSDNNRIAVQGQEDKDGSRCGAEDPTEQTKNREGTRLAQFSCWSRTDSCCRKLACRYSVYLLY
jgi:hypothetical protein